MEAEAACHQLVLGRAQALERVRVGSQLEGVEVDLVVGSGVVDPAREVGVGPSVVGREDRLAAPAPSTV